MEVSPTWTPRTAAGLISVQCSAAPNSSYEINDTLLCADYYSWPALWLTDVTQTHCFLVHRWLPTRNNTVTETDPSMRACRTAATTACTVTEHSARRWGDSNTYISCRRPQWLEYKTCNDATSSGWCLCTDGGHGDDVVTIATLTGDNSARVVSRHDFCPTAFSLCHQVAVADAK